MVLPARDGVEVGVGAWRLNLQREIDLRPIVSGQIQVNALGPKIEKCQPQPIAVQMGVQRQSAQCEANGGCFRGRQVRQNLHQYLGCAGVLQRLPPLLASNNRQVRRHQDSGDLAVLADDRFVFANRLLRKSHRVVFERFQIID